MVSGTLGLLNCVSTANRIKRDSHVGTGTLVYIGLICRSLCQVAKGSRRFVSIRKLSSRVGLPRGCRDTLLCNITNFVTRDRDSNSVRRLCVDLCGHGHLSLDGVRRQVSGVPGP